MDSGKRLRASAVVHACVCIIWQVCAEGSSSWRSEVATPFVEATLAAVGAKLPAVTFEELGPVIMKGIPAPIRLYRASR
jgi:hypothetical protein